MALSSKKITEVEQIEKLLNTEDVYVKQGDTFRRIPLSVFFAELWDGRVDNAGTEYPKIGDYIRHIEESLSTIKPDVDLSNLCLKEIDGVLYLYDSSKEETIGDGWTITGGGGGGSFGSTMRLVNRMTSRTLTINDSVESYPILYSWTSTDDTDNTPTGDGSATWQVGSTVVARETVHQGNNSFDVRQYLTNGVENAIKLTIEDAYGNSRSMTWTVMVASYGLTWNMDEISAHGANSVPLRLVPTGSGTKVLKISVDGTEVYSESITTTGRTVSVTIDAQAHGAHTVKAWLEISSGGSTITTDPLVHVGIWTAAGNTTPVIAVLDSAPTAKQYETIAIKWMLYDPANETATAQLRVGSETVATVTVGRTVQTWAYRPTATGTLNLLIVDGSVSAAIVLTVTSIGYDISPVTNGLVLDVNPAGHTNTEANVTSFGYTDGSGISHPFAYSENFDWVNGGFKQDADGVTALVIKRGTYIQLDRSFFNDNAKTSGKEIKIVFKATEVRDYDAEILTCKANGIGLKLQAQQATLTSELQSRAIPYCEDTKIEMDINIEASSENKLAVVWLEGSPARAFGYSDTDNWTQAAPEQVKIGSTDADVWLYRVKMYANSLTRYEIIDNFVADCSDTAQMVARYERNNIFSANGAIDLNALAVANPQLRVIHIWADRMTTAKSDEVTCTVECVYKGGGADFYFYATNVVMKAQGTSSLEYILAALNLDLDFSKATWTNGNGEFLSGYAMTENSIPVDYLNIKLNIASSENANNVILADDYNAYQPNITKLRADNAAVRDTVQGVPCAIFFTSTADAPIAVGARTVQAGETILYGCGDLNNSKKNFAVFGQTEDYPEVMCVEISNNNNAQCRFKSDDLSEETWDGNGNFEFRYPKSPTATQKAAWQALLSWVVSTDTTAATGAALPASVTYDGVAYTNDTAAYRSAKFKAELADHFNVNSLLYHYLFTERHCMVDNRAKNCFVSYEPDTEGNYRWNFNKDYDNDTALGCDNSGGLTFTYGLEDTDSVGASKVFNASDSVLWVNLRALFSDELKAMFLDRESAGAWSASRLLSKFLAHQAARPEALVAEDMWGKYFSAYLYNTEEERYINQMLGTKVDQRRQFEIYQEGYMASKYRGSVATADRISLRVNAPDSWSGVEPDGDILSVVPYADTYLRVQYGNAAEIVTRAKKGQTYTLECPDNVALNDLETYIYRSSIIKSIGSMAALYTKFADISAAIRLQRLLLGSAEDGYENTGMTAEYGGVSVGSNKMLEVIDLRGATALAKPLDLSGLAALRELYLTNSAITGVTFAPGAPLEKAYLPALRTLVARGLTKLQTFSMSGASLTSLWVENSPQINTQTLCIDATGLVRGRITGADWTLQNASLLLRLANLAGLDSNGANADHFVLTGAAFVARISQTEYDTVTAAFPSLVVTYGELVPTFTVTFKGADGSVLNTQTVTQYGAAVDPVATGLIPTPTKAPTVDKVYTFTSWNKSFAYVTENLEVTAVFTESARSYTVKWWNNLTLLQEQTVEVYSDAVYSGDMPYRSANDIFTGWDKVSTNVQSDLNVNALFEAASVPAVKATDYDYLYSDESGDNSGYSLGELFGIINSGQAATWFELGDKIKILTPTTAFTDTSIVLSLIGFNHFRLADGTAMAKTVWHMIGAMSAPYKHHTTNVNTGGWAQSDIRTYLNETVLKNLPIHWQALIKTVQVKSSIGGLSAEISTSQDKLFLLSAAEVTTAEAAAVPYKNEVDAEADNLTFAVFTDNNSRIRKTFNAEGSAVYWWLRSPDPSSATNFRCVTNNGGVSASGAGVACSLAWGFCI